MTMPRPSLVTSSGPSPVLGFMAAMRHPLPRRGSCPFARTGRRGGHGAYLQPLSRHGCDDETTRHEAHCRTNRRAPDAGPGLASRRRTRMSSPTDGDTGSGRPPVAVPPRAACGPSASTGPSAMNALDVATKVALRDAAAARPPSDPAVRCVVLTGTGRAFCVGPGPARARPPAERDGRRAAGRRSPEHYNPIALALATMPKPVVAAVNGVAAGAGAAFAFAARRAPGRRVRRLQPRLHRDRAVVRLRLVVVAAPAGRRGQGQGAAAAARARSAPQEALDLGLATEVVPDAELAERTARAGAAARRRPDGGVRRRPAGGGLLGDAPPGRSRSPTRPS